MIEQISNLTAPAVQRVQQASGEKPKAKDLSSGTSGEKASQALAEDTEKLAEGPVLLPDSVELSEHFSEITQPTVLPQVEGEEKTGVDLQLDLLA